MILGCCSAKWRRSEGAGTKLTACSHTNHILEFWETMLAFGSIFNGSVVLVFFCGPKSALSVGLKSSLKDVTLVESEKQFLSSCGLSFIGGENIAPNPVTLYPVVFLPV